MKINFKKLTFVGTIHKSLRLESFEFSKKKIFLNENLFLVCLEKKSDFHFKGIVEIKN